MVPSQKVVGSTSEIWHVYIEDFAGNPLSGLAYSSSGLLAYYNRNTSSSSVLVSLVDMTLGLFTSSGFKEIDATNLAGWYQFCPPDAALAAGAKSVAFCLYGAANQKPLDFAVQLTAFDLDASLTAASILARTLGAESYATDGAIPTLEQALFMVLSMLGEVSISGTTWTSKKLDGSTTAMTFTLNSGVTPTSLTRTT
jgi:hypothetical protein